MQTRNSASTTTTRRKSRPSRLKSAAAAETLAVDRHLHLVGVSTVAHSVAALRVHHVHVDPRRLIDLAGNADDRLRPGLADWLRPRERESDVMLVDQHVPEGLGADRVIGWR